MGGTAREILNKLDQLIGENKKITKAIQRIDEKQDALAKIMNTLSINNENEKNTNQVTQSKGLVTLTDFAIKYDLTIPMSDRDQLKAFEEKLKMPQCQEEFVS